jgi:predicted Zn-dependent protease with MMP-like domain
MARLWTRISRLGASRENLDDWPKDFKDTADKVVIEIDKNKVLVLLDNDQDTNTT